MYLNSISQIPQLYENSLNNIFYHKLVRMKTPKRKMLYFGRHAFSTLLFSAIEAYYKECSGLLFGYLTPEGYQVNYTIPFQIVRIRSRFRVVEDPKLYQRIKLAQRSVTGDFLLGGYHSHTKTTKVKASTDDLRYLKETPMHDVEVILSIKKIDYLRDWSYDKLDVKCYVQAGEEPFMIKIGGYYLEGGRVKRLNVGSDYVDMLFALQKSKISNIYTIGNLMERAKRVSADLDILNELLSLLESSRTDKEDKQIVKKIESLISY